MSYMTSPPSTHKAVPVSKRKRALPDELPAPKKSKAPVPERSHQVHYDTTVSQLDAAMLSDYLAQQLKRHANDRTALELEDQFIPASAIRDTSSFVEPRVSKHLPSFLRSVAGGEPGLTTCAAVASPHTVIITASGIRAADLTRELRSLATDDYKIAKLFAKHMKLKDTIDFMQKHKVIIGVGTPARLKELIDREAIMAAAIKRIVIDGSYVDEKKRTIFDMKEIYLPMLELLNLTKVKSQMSVKPNGLELMVF